MKSVTYTLLGGEKKTIEYNEKAPCIYCGLPVVEASMGGTVVCPWCDMGMNRQGDRIVKPRMHTKEEYEQICVSME